MCSRFSFKYVLLLAISVFAPLEAVGNETTTETSTEDIQLDYIGDFPFQVSLHYSYNEEFICGGSIVSSKIVLTAARCMYYKWGGLLPPIILTVAVGKQNLNQTATETFSVASITLHPDYDQTMMQNDLAVVEINDRFPIDDSVGRVSLETTTLPRYYYNNCIVVGWNQGTYNLEATEVFITECEYYPNNICSLKKNENDSICINEAGNPLICDQNLIGILIVGPDCNEPSQMTIFEDVRNSMAWLNEFEFDLFSPSDAHLPVRSLLLFLHLVIFTIFL